MRISKGAQRRADKAKELAAGVSVNHYHRKHQFAAHYSIHDRKRVNTLLAIQHDAITAQHEKLGLPGKPMPLADRLFQSAKRYVRQFGLTGKFYPNKGQREMERRRLGGFHTLHN